MYFVHAPILQSNLNKTLVKNNRTPWRPTLAVVNSLYWHGDKVHGIFTFLKQTLTVLLVYDTAGDSTEESTTNVSDMNQLPGVLAG